MRATLTKLETFRSIGWSALFLSFLLGHSPPLKAHTNPELTSVSTPAQGYQYVRFVAQQTNEGIHIYELTLLNGEVTYPKLPMNERVGSREASVVASETDSYNNAYRLFDRRSDDTFYLRRNNTSTSAFG